MSGRRPAAAAAVSDTSPEGEEALSGRRRAAIACSCTNIAVMQLFHEMKQQFPAVADDVVSACIADHCHDRPACHARLLREAAAAVPRALPYPRTVPPSSPAPPQSEPRTPADGTAAPRDRLPPRPGASASVVCASDKTFCSDPCASKPPISPSTNKRFATRRLSASKTPDDTNRPTTSTSTSTISDETSNSPGVVSATPRRPAPTPPPVRPASLDLPQRPRPPLDNPNTSPTALSSSVNVSVNVNCSVDLVPSPGQTRRHSTVLEVTPEPVWCQHLPTSTSSGGSSPRSFTSVNLTLRTPTSEPQPPIEIWSSPAAGASASLTYTTSSFDSRQGLQSRLQITVGPGTGTVTALRTRPRSSYHPDGAPLELPTPPPVRAGSMPDLANTGVTSTTNHVILLSRQLERKEQLRNELEVGRERLSAIRKEIQALRLENTPEYRNRLKKEIRHLQSQCERLTQEVDRHSESRVPLGETNEEFYRHIYTGQRGTLRPPRQRQQQQRRPPAPPPLYSAAAEADNEPRWPCHICTFRNHPLMDKCEQCEMPRILLGKPPHPTAAAVAPAGQLTSPPTRQHATNQPLALSMNI